MTNEQMERAIEFLLSSQAQLTADMQGLKDVQAQTSADVRVLVETVSRLENQMAEGFARFEAQAESDRQEIRESFDSLILANEVTRKFSEDIARLEVQTSQRVTSHDDQIAALAEQGKETDARLNTLINIVERHITNTNAHKDDQ